MTTVFKTDVKKEEIKIRLCSQEELRHRLERAPLNKYLNGREARTLLTNVNGKEVDQNVVGTLLFQLLQELPEAARSTYRNNLHYIAGLVIADLNQEILTAVDREVDRNEALHREHDIQALRASA